jgi:hypothetical protein
MVVLAVMGLGSIGVAAENSRDQADKWNRSEEGLEYLHIDTMRELRCVFTGHKIRRWRRLESRAKRRMYRLEFGLGLRLPSTSALCGSNNMNALRWAEASSAVSLDSTKILPHQLARCRLQFNFEVSSLTNQSDPCPSVPNTDLHNAVQR